MRLLGLVAFFGLLAQSPLARAAPGKLETPATVTPSHLPSGATYTSPAGWSRSVSGPFTLLVSPEGSLRIGLYETTELDARAAVRATWKLLDPSWKKEPSGVMPGRVLPGWDEHLFFVWDMPPNATTMPGADTFRAGKRVVVMLVTGPPALREQRRNDIARVGTSLFPAGYVAERFGGKTAHRLEPARIAVLRDFLTRAMKTAEIPGVAFALVEQGKVVVEEGLGVRELGKPEPVSAHTAFQVGQVTEALTTLLAARRVDQAKVRWDQKLSHAWPELHLRDAGLASQAQLRHLGCDCLGLSPGDTRLLFDGPGATAASRLTLLSSLPMTGKLGEYQPSPLPATALGLFAGHLARPTAPLEVAYAQALQTEILTPAGMNDSTFDGSQAHERASAHDVDVDGHLRVAVAGFNDWTRSESPAVGLWSSAHDLARYLQLELGGGVTPEGTRVVSEKNLLVRRERMAALGDEAWFGLGLAVVNVSGVKVVQRSSQLSGAHAAFFFLPDAQVGAVVLTNAENGWFITRAFGRRLLEILYDGNPMADADVTAMVTASRQHTEGNRKDFTVPADAKAAGLLSAHYRCAELGTLEVVRVGARTWFDFGAWRSEVASHANADGTTSFTLVSPGVQQLEFVRASGANTSLKLQEFVFTPEHHAPSPG